MRIPSSILRHLYTYGSLSNVEGGFRFAIKNQISDATLVEVRKLILDGNELDLEKVELRVATDIHPAFSVSSDNPVPFHIGQKVDVYVKGMKLDLEKAYVMELSFRTKKFGILTFDVEDRVVKRIEKRISIPYNKSRNYDEDIIIKRREFIEEYSGVKLENVSRYSIDPLATKGNIENFTGVAQVPLGFAGPLRINGEYANGDFIIPLATSEGTLVASYNRGMKVLNLSGGVTTTFSIDRMQRAPVFIFDSARGARDFSKWVEDNEKKIARLAEATSRVAKLKSIDRFLSNKFVFLRFNYTTGDAAGQNMVGKATFFACSWIMENYEGIRNFYLESNFATDKKGSQVNILHTRGKRVTAEATIPREVLLKELRVEPETLEAHARAGTLGAFISGANNNGLQSANAITAMFIATGQDVANVSESSCGILYCEITEEGDLYLSLTLPSLIVATYGGGTKLPTQKECLDVLGCYGEGKVRKFAEIVTAVALAGELSLAAAISSLEWVSSHDELGRNR
jgi:hydroxymethylglutaryl-CoA reductase (NADPH)